MRFIMATILLAAPFAVTTSADGASFTYTTITVPGITGAEVTGINDSGQVSGFGGAGEVLKGFLSDNQGKVTTIFQPSSSSTEALGLNDSGQVVGTYVDNTGGHHAFVGTATILTPIAIPGAAGTPEANGINNVGQIVGDFSGAGIIQGFLDSSGTFTTLLVPGSSGTQALGLNNSGEIVGTYFDSTGGRHAFVYLDGVFTSLNAPNAANTTSANGINDSGEIVGTYSNSAGMQGFLDDNGAFSTISFPGASGTELMGIDDAGQIVGNYFDSNGAPHPFLATPVSSVPEPYPIALTGLSLLALVALRFQRVLG